jgi:GNAT superfamily N-acetyltransferase
MNVKENDNEETVIIRTATPADFPAIREVAKLSRLHSFKHFMTEDEVEEEVQHYYNDAVLNGILNNPANAIYLAELGNTLLGYLSVLPKDRKGRPRLLQFYVRPENQRRGVGQMLFERGTAFLRQAGVKEMFISTVAENTMGRRFYEKKGAHFIQEYDSIWDGKVHALVVYLVAL